jgi:hypothetical protein
VVLHGSNAVATLKLRGEIVAVRLDQLFSTAAMPWPH